MRLKAIWKDTFRELSNSVMRFLAILVIILLGVGFFVGISATGPDMVETAEEYYSDLNLMDYRIVSTYGLTDKDIEDLENIEEMDIQTHYANDFIVDDYAETIRLYSLDLDKGQDINQYLLVKGRLPENSKEIALDTQKSFLEGLEIGDTISLEDNEDAGDPEDNLEQTSFEIVGFVNSPLFIEEISRGTSTIGSGTLDGFGVVAEDAYDTDYRTEAYLINKSIQDYPTYGDQYNDYIDNYATELEDTLDDLEERRTTEVEDEIQDEIDEGWEEIDEAEEELADAEEKLQDARKELDEGWEELEQEQQNFQEETASAQQEIDDNQANLQDKQQDLETQEQELTQQKQELETELNQLNENEPELNNGIQQIEQGIQEIDAGLTEIEDAEEALTAEFEELTENKEEGLTAKQVLETALEEADDNEKEQIQQQLSEIDVNLEEITIGEQEINQGLEEIDNQKQPLLDQKAELEAERDTLYEQRDQLRAGKAELEQGISEIDDGLAQMDSAHQEIDEGFAEIENAQRTLDEEINNGQTELDQAEADLEEGETEYQENLNEFEEEKEDAEEEIADGKKELEDLEDELDTLTMPEYLLFDRSDNLGYLEYEDNADRLSIIAKVFPAFFFLIAIFISFTTMTRMVDEEREYIGIMKALGYKNRHILIKFITYALLATTLGAVFGLVIGYTLLPKLIFFAYSSMYNFPEIILKQYTLYTIIALLAAYISTVGASLIAVRQSLKSNAATLLQPKAPKSGSRIWLEKISFIWKRLSFNQKITFRNVFRYKSRMLMTILGIAGSTGLILTGFGISDSISDIPDIQYGDINQFQAYVALDSDLNTDEINEYSETITEYDEIEDALLVDQENTTTKSSKINTQDVSIFIPENTDEMNDFIDLRESEGNESYTLDDSGAYITQKLAQLLGAKTGDEIEIENSDDETWSVEIAGIAENYIGHFLYMTPEYYTEMTDGEDPNYNTQLIKYNENEVDADELGNKLMDEDEVIGINYVSEMHDGFADTLHSLDLITQILVASAAALAFIVLYNLTNINVSERQRELSTIKVLGSYDHEVTMYIYRENIILTVLGIFLGFGFGTILTNFIMDTMEVDMLVFGRTIHFISYLYSGVLTIIFSLIVMLVIHFQLKRIDMVEALKAND